MQEVELTLDNLAADQHVTAIVSRELHVPDIDVALIVRTTAIETPAAYAAVAELWKHLKAEIKRRTDYFRGIDGTGSSRIGRAYRVYQDWLRAEHDSIDALVTHERMAALLIGNYDMAQRRAAEAETRRLQAEAEARSVQEQLDAALDAEQDGAIDIATEILDAPAAIAPVSVPVSTPQVYGMSTASRWKASVTNLQQLILAAADEIAHKKPYIAVSMLKVDQVALNRQATSMKGNLKAIAGRLGLHVYEDSTPRSSRS